MKSAAPRFIASDQNVEGLAAQQLDRGLGVGDAARVVLLHRGRLKQNVSEAFVVFDE
jgi:hypothetical protein